ncbi:hypothetical protein PHPALM_31741 [Phytophthora palmivora]|uniref:Transmembrane protein n=1 Tax=Phytophthora palmivora TaxID=4796 RepID=A0A2P4X1V1_9STRA|nr:hypothetical protein PHPALM_31741 [Phytophthora palmivora]
MVSVIARVVPTKNITSKRPGHGGKKRITGAQLLNLVRRIAGVCAALMYAGIGLQSAYTTIDVLKGTNIGTESFGTMEAELIVGYCGDGLIRESPLVHDVLGGDTTPRTDTLYLQSPTSTSFEKCTDIELFDSDIYNASFLNDGFLGLIESSTYNLTILQDIELIMPVVDCTSPPLVTGDPSLLRVYNLVRRKSDPDDVHIVAVSLSVQDYRVVEQSRRGSAILATLFSVNDMRATNVNQYFVLGLDYPYTSAPVFNVFTLDGISENGFWEMSSVPHNASIDPIIHARTARRRGFYLHAESEQANMRNLFWKVDDQSPATALSVWEWFGEPVIIDSWAWVHGIHIIFAWQTIFSLGVLSIVVFRNLHMGKVWIGDAFASVSNGTLMMRGLLVLGSWYVNEYWTLAEFCLFNANEISGTQKVQIHSELAHADLLVMFLSIIGLIGRFTRERIDPAFALFLFEIIHSNRQEIIRKTSSVLKVIVKYVNAEYRAGIATVTDEQKLLSPMRLWTTHMLNGIDFGFLAASLFPKLLLVLLILVYVGIRKVYHRFYPDQQPTGIPGRSSADRSANEKAAMAQKGNLTNFEISTGAELEARYGLISDYKNYIFFKGLKFASADGVYCSGYVVANGRFLVGSKDLLSIIMIKAFRSRFTNVYVYAVDGNTVQRTAQLREMGSMDKIMQPPKSIADVRIVRLIHRVAVFIVAVVYVHISLQSFSTALVVLRGQVSHDLPSEVYTSNLINGYAGTATIAQSPLVQQVLDGSTSPRNNSLYLETSSAQSYTGCSDIPNFDKGIYSNEFMRLIFSRLQEHASYNLSYVAELELVLPVVDCTFELLVSGDRTVARIYYLVRKKNDPTKVLLLSTSLSAQDYHVDQQFQKGPGLVLLVVAIDDTQATALNYHIAVALNYPYVADPVFAYSELEGIDSENYWILQTLPNERNQDPAKIVRMARRFGRYKSDVTAQSNIEIAHWGMTTDPMMELREWIWNGRAVLHDSWAWTHAIHGVFALNVIFNLSVLTFVIYRRFRMGHIWVGDAFSTISNMLLYRGVIVLVCNHLNGYWTITKMCISIGDSITAQHAIYYKPELVHADLLSVYLNSASVLSYLTRERIDPLVAFLTFELGWRYRLELANMFPALRKHITDFAIADLTSGLLHVSPGIANLSPIDLLTAYQIESDRKPVVFSAVISIFSPIVLMLAYILGRKSTGNVNFPFGLTREKGTGNVRRTTNAYRKGLEENKLTSFEVATGAALTKRFGVVSGYENYVIHDNKHIATIDAVYGNGFLVVNGKFLIGAQDLLPLILMKLTHVRFTNIFIYDIVERSAVKETAELVYPSTITWSDLQHLDVTALT